MSCTVGCSISDAGKLTSKTKHTKGGRCIAVTLSSYWWREALSTLYSLFIYLCLNAAKWNETKDKWFLEFLSTYACAGLRLCNVGVLSEVASINWRFSNWDSLCICVRSRQFNFVLFTLISFFCILMLEPSRFFTFSCKSYWSLSCLASAIVLS